MKSGKRCIKETIFVRVSLASNIPSSPLPFPYTLLDTYICTCARVCMYVCMCADACRENARVGLYIAASCFIGTNLSLVRYDTLSANAINELVQPVFIFLRFSNFSLDIIFCFIATSKAIPNYPSLNIQRMGRKGGTKREEVYYVISFSTGKYGEYAYFQRRGIRSGVYV